MQKLLFILSFVLLATINASAQRVKIHTTMGDIVVRIVSLYIDNPLNLILKPWPEDEYE